MYDQSGRFINHHQVFVFINNQWNVFGDNIIVVTRTVHHDSQHHHMALPATAFTGLPFAMTETSIGCFLDSVAEELTSRSNKYLSIRTCGLTFIHYHRKCSYSPMGLPHSLYIIQCIIGLFHPHILLSSSLFGKIVWNQVVYYGVSSSPIAVESVKVESLVNSSLPLPHVGSIKLRVELYRRHSGTAFISDTVYPVFSPLMYSGSVTLKPNARSLASAAQWTVVHDIGNITLGGSHIDGDRPFFLFLLEPPADSVPIWHRAASPDITGSMGDRFETLFIDFILDWHRQSFYIGNDHCFTMTGVVVKPLQCSLKYCYHNNNHGLVGSQKAVVLRTKEFFKCYHN